MRILHFIGKLVILKVLKTILDKILYRDDPTTDKVKVFCYSQHLSRLTCIRIQQLVSEYIELRLSSTR